MPNYNSVFLERAINSVINQIYNNWELIIIDNLSYNSPDILIMKLINKKIKYYKFNNHNNIAKSRNFGITKSKYDWIAFLDSDDVWDKKKLLEVKRVFEKKNSDLVYHTMCYLPKSFGFIKKKIIDKSNHIEEPIFDSLIKSGNGIANSSVVVKKNKLIEIDLISEKKEKYSWEDYDCWLRLASKKIKFDFVSEPLGYIWVGHGRVSNDRQSYINSKNFLKIYRNSISNILGKKYKRPMWIMNIYGNYFFKTNQYLKSFYFYKNFIKKNFRIRIKYLILHLVIFYKKILLKLLIKSVQKIKSIFNQIHIYELKEIDKKQFKELEFDNFKFKIIKKYEEFQNFNNYLNISNNKFFYERFKKYNDEMIILIEKKNNNIACYGWISRRSPHYIEEINKNFFFKFGFVLYDFKTVENYRNMKLYKYILNKIIYNLKFPLYIYSLSSNKFSKKTILNSGFKTIKILNNFSNDFVQKNIK